MIPDDLDALLALLAHPERQPIVLGLERVLELLEALGNPHLRLPPVVHVAGTNGKGSTLAFVRAILEAHGRHVHVYTSPHLVRFHERIVLAGEEIPDAVLRPLLHRVIEASRAHPVTFFEAATAVALLAFAEHPADFTLLETGMGGRLDATNVVPAPAVTALTPIGLDHTEFLGDTLAAVAMEKAGILKPGVPCVVAPQPPEALAAIERVAARVDAPLYFPRASDAPLSLAGPHQSINAAVALAIVERLGIPLDPAHLREGLAHARWPGRLQHLGGERWLDGGHNPAAAEALAVWARAAAPPLPLVLICGMMARKDVGGFLAPFRGVATEVVGVPIPGTPDAHPAEAIAHTARSLGFPARTAEDAPSALASIPASSRVLICGSLYLAGAVLA